MASASKIVSRVRVSSLAQAAKELSRVELVVGIPEDSQRLSTGGSGEPPTNALVGYVMENGDSEKNIPPRPFLVPGVEAIKPRIVLELGLAASAVLNGHTGAAVKALNRIGLLAAASVKAVIAAGEFTPLAPSTIRARARAGGPAGSAASQYLAQVKAGSSPDPGLVKPLNATGQLKNSVTFKVRDREK